VAKRDLVHRIGAPAFAALVLAGADREHGARSVAGADDGVARVGRAMHEIPLRKGALLALHDQQRLPGEDEKVFLVGLPVVHGHRLTRPEHGEVDRDLREIRSPLERQDGSGSVAAPPAGLAGVQDEPALRGRGETVLGLFDRRFGSHGLARTIRDHPRHASHRMWSRGAARPGRLDTRA